MDFCDERLPVPGHLPVGRLPPAAAHSNTEAFVEECRRHAKFVVYSVETVGEGESARTEPRAKVPTREKFKEMARGELNEQQEAAYNKWVEKWGTSRASGVADPAAPPNAARHTRLYTVTRSTYKVAHGAFCRLVLRPERRHLAS